MQNNTSSWRRYIRPIGLILLGFAVYYIANSFASGSIWVAMLAIPGVLATLVMIRSIPSVLAFFNLLLTNTLFFGSAFVLVFNLLNYHFGKDEGDKEVFKVISMEEGSSRRSGMKWTDFELAGPDGKAFAIRHKGHIGDFKPEHIYLSRRKGLFGIDYRGDYLLTEGYDDLNPALKPLIDSLILEDTDR